MDILSQGSYNAPLSLSRPAQALHIFALLQGPLSGAEVKVLILCWRSNQVMRQSSDQTRVNDADRELQSETFSTVIL